MPRLSPFALAAALLATPLVTACGQKGPLYLPDKPPPAEAKKYPQKPDKPAE
ncbi:MAG: lipoprotein [Gammaproteobacteria bacterium]|jgi:predicted small lipoprotein YifL|nr:lipoprotein [Gammaproteobacteria bacterium]